MASLAPYFDQRWYAADGVTPAAGYKLFTYAAGTDTKKATYKNYAGGTSNANANPIVLSATGTADVWLKDGLYKFVLCDPSETDPITGSPIRTVDNVGFQALQTVSTFTALRALTAGSAGDCVHVLGYAAAGDGGEGFFYWNTASATADDGGVTILPDASPSTGRWVRCFTGEVNVKWFGLAGNGTTDDSDQYTKAEAYCNTNNCTIYFPAGTYVLSHVVLRVNMRGSSAHEVMLLHPLNTLYDMIAASASVVISDLTLDGQALQSIYTVDLIKFTGTKIEVKNCIFERSTHASIEIVDGDANIHDNIFTDMYDFDSHSTMLSCAVYAVGLTSQTIQFNNNQVYLDAAPGTPANAAGGIIVGGTGVTLQADNNFFNYIGQATTEATIGCISATTGAKIVATGNVIKNAERGIYLSASTNNIINGNQFLDCTYGVVAVASSSFVASGNMNNSASGTYGYSIATGLSLNPCKIIGDTIIGPGKGIYAVTGNSALQLEVLGTTFGSDNNDVHAVSCASVLVENCNFTTSAGQGALLITGTALVMVQDCRSVAASPMALSGNTKQIERNNSWQTNTMNMKEGTDNITFGAANGAAEGWKIVVSDAQYVFADVASKTVLDISDFDYVYHPIILLSAIGNLETTITTSESATWVSVGITGDPYKYSVSTALTKNSKIFELSGKCFSYLSGDILVSGSKVTNAAAKITGTVRVRLIYGISVNLADAA